MHQLPETRLLRINQILGNPKANPPIPPLIPVSKSTWWAGVAAGRYPQAVRIGRRCTAWKASEIFAFIERTGKEG